MTDRKTLYDGASYAAWGYLLYYFDINLGTVSILPRFVGFLLLLDAAKAWKEERRDLGLLRPLGLLLAAWYGADWLLSWRGGTVGGKSLFLELLVSAANLYFHFQFLTDAAALAAKYQPPEGTLDRDILRLRTAQTVLITAIAALYPLALQLEKIRTLLPASLIMAGLAVAGAVMGLMLILKLFELRRLFREEDPAALPPASPE